MRKIIGIVFLTAFVFGIQFASAQDASQSQSQTQSSAKPSTSKPQAQKESVAEAARKAQETSKTAPKAPVVFDNDNIGAAAGSGTVNVVGNAPAAESSTSSSTQPGQASATSSSSSDEASWRQKFADAHTKLQQDQSDLALMQRELQQLRVQYYPNDPQKALKQSVSSQDVNKKQQAIVQKQKQIQADQQALSDLEDQLRKSGGDPAWARQ